MLNSTPPMNAVLFDIGKLKLNGIKSIDSLRERSLHTGPSLSSVTGFSLSETPG